MAVIMGQSGGYREVLNALQKVGLSVRSIDDVSSLRQTLEANRESLHATALAEYDARTQQLREECAITAQSIQQTLVENDVIYSQKKAVILAELEAASVSSKAVGSFLSNLIPPTRIRIWWKALRRLDNARFALNRLNFHHERTRRTAGEPLDRLRSQLQAHLNGREQYLTTRRRHAEQQLACVVRLLEEGEVGGASAELEVIRQLELLPAEWFVINDVRLESDRWYRFDGKHLKTAQLDHVVVGPGGIFVIETKNWSREFTESGAYFCPYEQSARAAYLCHKGLEQHGLPCRTRCIIATRSKLPPKPKDSYTKVLRPEELRGYIQWFKPEVEPRVAEAIAMHLGRFVGR